MKLGTLGLMPLIAMVACQPQSTAQIPQDKGMEPFAKDKEFHKAHTLREPTGVAPKGKEVVLKVGESKVKCYWNAPKEGQGQVVLMIHEWWGLNDNIRETADALGKETGYGVLAVDLYEGKVAKNADEAAKAMAAVNATKASATVNAAIRAIKNGVDGTKPASKFGTIGYCFGGGWSHKAAIMGGKDVQACVIYYGMPVIAPGAVSYTHLDVYKRQERRCRRRGTPGR